MAPTQLAISSFRRGLREYKMAHPLDVLPEEGPPLDIADYIAMLEIMTGGKIPQRLEALHEMLIKCGLVECKLDKKICFRPLPFAQFISKQSRDGGSWSRGPRV
jgi:hypothetical protein